MMIVTVIIMMAISMMMSMMMLARMIVVMTVIVMMVMPVIVTVSMSMVVMVAMMMMVMIMVVIVTRRRSVGLERRFDHGRLQAALLEQYLDLGIGPDPQPVGEQLDRSMAVAEQPGDAGERGRIGDARLDHRLGRRHDLHQLAVIEQQRVVRRERRRFLECELDAGAFAGEHETLLGGALGEIEDQRVGDRRRVRGAGAQDLLGKRHGGIRQLRRAGRSSSAWWGGRSGSGVADAGVAAAAAAAASASRRS